jgi:hypothetical protein
MRGRCARNAGNQGQQSLEDLHRIPNQCIKIILCIFFQLTIKDAAASHLRRNVQRLYRRHSLTAEREHGCHVTPGPTVP